MLVTKHSVDDWGLTKNMADTSLGLASQSEISSDGAALRVHCEDHKIAPDDTVS